MIKVEFDVDEAALGIPVAEAADRIRESLGLNGAWYELPCNVADKVYENKVTIDCLLARNKEAYLAVDRQRAKAAEAKQDCERLYAEFAALRDAANDADDSSTLNKDLLVAAIMKATGAHKLGHVDWVTREACYLIDVQAQAIEEAKKRLADKCHEVAGGAMYSDLACSVDQACGLIDEMAKWAKEHENAPANGAEFERLRIEVKAEQLKPGSVVFTDFAGRLLTSGVVLAAPVNHTCYIDDPVNEEKPTCGECANLDRTTTACGVCRVNRTWRTFDQEICRNEFARRAPASKPVCSACGWFRGSAMHKAGVCAKNATCVSGGNEACELFVRR